MSEKSKTTINGVGLTENKHLRWKLCRVIDGRFYSLFFLGATYKKREINQGMQDGLILEYKVGQTTTPEFGGVFAYDNFFPLNMEYGSFLGRAESGFEFGILVGRGPACRRQRLFFDSLSVFREWRSLHRNNHRRRALTQEAHNLFATTPLLSGITILGSFTPLWSCCKFPRGYGHDVSRLVFESA